MADSPFVFELVTGVYIDADGNLLPGPPPPGAPTYSTIWKALGDDASKIKDALNGIKDAMDGVQKNKTFLLDLHVWADAGTGETVLKFIKGVSAAAGTIAPIFAAVSIAIQIGQMLKLFSTGPDPMQQLINERFDQLETLMVGDSQQNFLSTIGDMRGPSLNLSDYTKALADMQGNMTLADYLMEQHDKLNNLTGDTSHLLLMFDATDKWKVLQEPSVLKTWQSFEQKLFCVTETGDLSPCLFSIGPRFDHRIMVPFVTEATTRYLTCLKTLVPEYRSTADFAPTLRRFADGLQKLAETMRDFNLAKTVYTAADFEVTLMASEVGESGFGILQVPVVKSQRWPVGAIDVLLHNDNYIKAQLAAPSQVSRTRAGCMDYGWTPPAQLKTSFTEAGNEYLILNPQACADAANAQSAKDYADLLTLSGYVQLMHLSALCRQQATEPDRSETVVVQHPPLLSYLNVVDQNVTVASNWILNLAHVTAKAVQRTRDCWASVRFKTQAIKRGHPQMQYRVVLRTLPDLLTYADYFKASYEPDPEYPGYLMMSMLRAPDAIDSKPIISDWTNSPADNPLHSEGTTRLRADTYNWYYSVVDPLAASMVTQASKLANFHQIATFFGALETPAKAESTMMTNTSSAGSASQVNAANLQKNVSHLIGQTVLVSQPPNNDPNRSPREKQTQEIEVQYVLDWDKDDLTVSLHVPAASRSVVVCVVLEEKFLLNHNNVMETAAEVPLDCLVTCVPEKFFEDEAKAIGQVGTAIAKNIPRVGIDLGNMHRPGPTEVELGLVSPTQWESLLNRIQATRPDKFNEMMTNIRRDIV